MSSATARPNRPLTGDAWKRLWHRVLGVGLVLGACWGTLVACLGYTVGLAPFGAVAGAVLFSIPAVSANAVLGLVPARVALSGWTAPLIAVPVAVGGQVLAADFLPGPSLLLSPVPGTVMAVTDCLLAAGLLWAVRAARG
ncbi:hypothetical protein [Kitasatospora sp. NPDC056184]|uniref:hypothetical protein n=1 Tax=Kitasatospora sp. NPDC056184 TaxID=3345738 RepID=UPI0035E390EA